VASARRLGWLYATLAAVAAVSVVAALVVALTRISFAVPSPAELAAACQRYAFPRLDVPSAFVLAIGSVTLAALVLTVRAALRQVRAARRFQRALPLAAVASAPTGVIVVDDPRPLAFCAGLLRPRVYISRGALAMLEPAEREAVLAHEAHHARRRDPLRLLVARALGDGMFFLPVMRRLADRYAALAEVAADDAAVRAMRSPRPLASALLAFDAHPSPSVVGIAPERVDHLMGERARWELPLLLLLGGIATIAALVALSVRVAEQTAHASVGLPELAAQACMLAMAVGPVVVGAALLLGGRRLLTRR
jgi:Zn-dependent protease with chaperone function